MPATDCKLPADNVMAYVGFRHKAEVERLGKLPLNVQAQGRCAASSRSVQRLKGARLSAGLGGNQVPALSSTSRQ
jgi:hypothetical protein